MIEDKTFEEDYYDWNKAVASLNQTIFILRKNKWKEFGKTITSIEEVE